MHTYQVSTSKMFLSERGSEQGISFQENDLFVLQQPGMAPMRPPMMMGGMAPMGNMPMTSMPQMTMGMGQPMYGNMAPGMQPMGMPPQQPPASQPNDPFGAL